VSDKEHIDHTETMLRMRATDYARSRRLDPDAAVAMIDRARLVVADDGEPLNVRELVDELLIAKPHLNGSYHPVPQEPASTVEQFRQARAARPMREATLRRIASTPSRQQRFDRAARGI
jgi:hypothetical protein